MNDRSSSETSRLGRLFAALGVIASLVFVGLELRQNTAAVRAQTRQGLADRNAEVIYAVAENPELARAWTLFWQRGAVPGQTMTMVDSAQARWAMWGMLRFVEHAFLQVEEGVLSEFASFWRGIRTRFDERFVAALEAEYDLR